MYKFLKNACPATGARLGTIKDMYFDVAYTYDIVWNFEKILVDREGRPRYRFHPGAWQESSKFVEKFLTEVMGDTNAGSQSANVVQAPGQQQPPSQAQPSGQAQQPSQGQAQTVPEVPSKTIQTPVMNSGNITLNDLMSSFSAEGNGAKRVPNMNRGWMQWSQPGQGQGQPQN